VGRTRHGAPHNDFASVSSLDNNTVLLLSRADIQSVLQFAGQTTSVANSPAGPEADMMDLA
jgi:hypothetical protein